MIAGIGGGNHLPNIEVIKRILLGQNGYERLIREFRVERNVESTERLYERLLQTNRRAVPSLQTSL